MPSTKLLESQEKEEMLWTNYNEELVYHIRSTTYR